MLAVPLIARGRVLGVIELVNGAGDPPFTEEDLTALTAIADYAAIAIENARNFRRVQELTITDEHTGLYNARHLRAQLEHEVTRARRFHHPLSLVFLDLDHFKTRQRRPRAPGGQRAAQGGGRAAASPAAGQVDLVFRYGGDEFAVLLVETGTGRRGAHRSASATRFRAHRVPAGQGLDLRVTASLGVATFPEHALQPPISSGRRTAPCTRRRRAAATASPSPPSEGRAGAQPSAVGAISSSFRRIFAVFFNASR